jgi:hypothetical protein
MAFVRAAVQAADAAVYDSYVGWCEGLHSVNAEKNHVQSNLDAFERTMRILGSDNQVLYQTPVSNYYLYGEGGAWSRMGDDLHLCGTTPGGAVTQVYPNVLQKDPEPSVDMGR